MYSTSSLVAWLLFEFESELSLSHHPSTRFETTFRISDHLAEKTTFFELKNRAARGAESVEFDMLLPLQGAYVGCIQTLGDAQGEEGL